MKKPDHNHPIIISPLPGLVQAIFGGRIIAESRRALSLKEASYPPVIYVPREDVRMEAFEKSARHTHCPYKGEANYYSIPGGHNGENAAWSYEDPYPAMQAIRNYLSFYPDRVELKHG